MERAEQFGTLPDVILIRRADASLQDWQDLGETVIAIGAQIEVDFEIQQATPEQQGTPRYATLADFKAIAKAHDRLEGVATRAWDVLRRVFYTAHNSGAESPIIFARHPKKESKWSHTSVFDDLDIASLAKATSSLRELIVTGDKRTYDCIHDVFGRNISIGIFQFLELVVASWPPSSEESTQ